MAFLAPLGFLALLSLPVLLWLWRFSASRRQTAVPSLIPFEHLLRRQPRRRTYLVVNWLFWLQLAALALLAAALAQPVWRHPRGRLILAVLDTSASMGAPGDGPSAFEQARRLLRAEIGRKPAADQWLLVTTAPVAALTPHPTPEAAVLLQALQGARVTHLSGNLATAVRIGRALAGAAPDALLIASDEPAPEGETADLRFLGVGRPVPNVGFVGLDAAGPLCQASDPRLVATVQNFSTEPAAATVTALSGARELARAELSLGPRARQTAVLSLPAEVAGRAEVTLHAQPDGMEEPFGGVYPEPRRGAPRPAVHSIRCHGLARGHRRSIPPKAGWRPEGSSLDNSRGGQGRHLADVGNQRYWGQ